MTKVEIVTTLSEFAGISRRDAAAVLDGLRDLAIEELRAGNDFVLPGMAKFAVAHREARMGRNVRTGEAIEIPARNVVRCKGVPPLPVRQLRLTLRLASQPENAVRLGQDIRPGQYIRLGQLFRLGSSSVGDLVRADPLPARAGCSRVGPGAGRSASGDGSARGGGVMG